MRQMLSVLVLFVLSTAAGPALHGAQPVPADEEKVSEFRTRLEPVPAPDLEDLDETVILQLTNARQVMEATIADAGVGFADLASAYGTLGRLYHAYELFDPALACYRNASLLTPQDYRWLHLQGDISRKEGRFEEATAQYQAAWAVQPNDFAALVQLGEIALESHEVEEARAAFAAALALNPGSPAAQAGLGQLALNQRDYTAAVEHFTTALAAVPDANRLHYSLALAYRGLKDMDRAREHLAQRGSVGIRPTDPLVDSLEMLKEGERVHLLRGRLAYAAERYQDAAAEFEAAVKADPSSVRSRINLGTTLAVLGDPNAAAKQYLHALELEPDQPTAHFNLGYLLLANRRAAEALPHLRATLVELPHDGQLRLMLAQALVATGDDLASLEHFEEAAKIDPASEEAVVGGAAALIRLGKYYQADSVLSAGAERLPNSGRISLSLARLLALCPTLDVRDGDRAVALAEKIHGAAPTPPHVQLMAQALAEAGRCEEAIGWQQQLIEAAETEDATEVLDILRADLAHYQTAEPCRPPGT